MRQPRHREKNVTCSASSEDLSSKYSNVYTHTHMLVVTVNAKRGHKFKREQGGPYREAWREERQERNVAIIL